MGICKLWTAIKIFLLFHSPGLLLTFLQRVSSNESQVVLDAVTMATSGKYSCEVSADAPSFHTLIAAAELEVIGKQKNSVGKK